MVSFHMISNNKGICANDFSGWGVHPESPFSNSDFFSWIYELYLEMRTQVLTDNSFFPYDADYIFSIHHSE